MLFPDQPHTEQLKMLVEGTGRVEEAASEAGFGAAIRRDEAVATGRETEDAGLGKHYLMMI